MSPRRRGHGRRSCHECDGRVRLEPGRCEPDIDLLAGVLNPFAARLAERARAAAMSAGEQLKRGEGGPQEPALLWPPGWAVSLGGDGVARFAFRPRSVVLTGQAYARAMPHEPCSPSW
jgi:hypothetical protein